MKFEKCFGIENYTENAYKSFSSWQDRLVESKNNIELRMDGKTVGSILAEMIGTIVWTIVSVMFLIFVRESNEVVPELNWITPVVTLLLLVLMFVEEFISLLYYGKIQKYKNSVKLMVDRISIGKQSFNMKKEDFYAAKQKGWEYKLKAGESIPDSAIKMESLMANMETIKGSYLPALKNILYFSDAILITLLGGISLFKMTEDLANDIMLSLLAPGSEPLEGDAIATLIGVYLFIACCVTVFLAKILWGKNNCTVNNISFLAMALGPVVFLLIAIFASCIIPLALWAVAIGIVGAIVVGCFYCTSSAG